MFVKNDRRCSFIIIHRSFIMRFKLLATSFALLITQAALAASPAKPTSCPAVDAFKNTGISSVMKDEDGSWLGIEWKNQFGTENEWTFAIGDIKADYASEALSKSNAVIASLVYDKGPIQMGTGQDPMWMCIYSSQGRFAGAAVTPARTPEISKLARLMQRR